MFGDVRRELPSHLAVVANSEEVYKDVAQGPNDVHPLCDLGLVSMDGKERFQDITDTISILFILA